MLSGIGMEQLRQGSSRVPDFSLGAGVRAGLFGGVYFLWGFRERGGVVFAEHRGTLAPIAGALILLFGLHLLGLLGKPTFTWVDVGVLFPLGIVAIVGAARCSPGWARFLSFPFR